MLTLQWLKNLGGVEAIEKINNHKADILYKEIDRNPLFEGTAAVEDRSKMNVTFVLKNKELEKEFLKLADERALSGLKGHRSVGGFRASIYNALPVESVQALIDAMQYFEKQHA
jgi:phosphoserine aminotransferase